MSTHFIKIYTDQEKLNLIQQFFQSGKTMQRFQNENHLGHCTLSKWMAKFVQGREQTDFPQDTMAEKKEQFKSIERMELEAEIKKLKQELEYEKLRATAFSTMIDVAEEQFGIDIRKKAGAKQ